MFTDFYGQTREQYEDCRDLIESSNQSSVSFVAIFFIIINSILLVVSTLYSGAKPLQGVYLISAVVMSIFCLLIQFNEYMKRHKRLQIYGVLTIILIFGTIVSVSNPTQKGTTYLVLLVIIPLLYIDRPISMGLYIVCMDVVYTMMVFKYKHLIEAYYDMYGCITFGSISIFAHYFLNVKMMRSIVNEKKMKNAISDYKRIHHQLVQKAEKDSLSGLYNRAAFIQIAKEHIERVKQERGMIILGILDIDHFKEINDKLGHQAGDRIIIEVSKVLNRTMRKDDWIGRLGGDEYIFILSNVQEKATVQMICERILASLNAIPICSDRNLEVSFGITRTNQYDLSFEELYSRADMALYRAKELGRNQYCLFEEIEKE